ncbi:MAG: ASKHA domain-containing protein [Myxococcota bacterium]|nr:ASKHA domain-containing protein [Myxococcota bacterium]
MTLSVEQHAAPILADHSQFSFEPREGFGVAVDIGTTTLVAQLVELATGRILASHTALNPQGARGSDVMSRLDYASRATARVELNSLIQGEVGKLVADCVTTTDLQRDALTHVVLVGNTAMHHLFSGLELQTLARAPFEPADTGLQEFSAGDLGWDVAGDVVVRFLPCLGGFVGSDILAGVLATRMHESSTLTALIDLGTNGEIVIGSRERLLCASTAAGPAFEAGGIAQGMRATRGAIDQVRVGSNTSDELRCHVVGGGRAKGICGSGLVDAVAAGLDNGLIEASGRLAGDGHKRLDLVDSVHLTQSDIRQLQLAKGAVAAGIRILLGRLGKSERDLQHLFLAGAFGNYVNRASAERIGLIPARAENCDAMGNSALLGAKLALFSTCSADLEFGDLRQRVEHIPLASSQEFHEIFIQQTRFPEAARMTPQL